MRKNDAFTSHDISVHMLARTFMTQLEDHARSIFLSALEHEGQEADGS